MLDLLRGPSWFDRSTITVILVCTVLTLGMVQFRKNKFNPKGQSGAHVTIVSRSQKKLDEALEKIETFRTSPSQKFASLAYDLSSVEGAEDAMDAAAEPFDGKYGPHELQVDGWRSRRRGSIVLTSSVLGFFAIPGYSAYTAIKHAIRGLAESLRIEFLLYNINVHCYFPATIYSPGFEEEQKSKPELTKIIEGADEGLTPEDCALRLVRGIEKGHVMITSDPIGHLFRNSMRGMSPVSNYILDPIFAAIAPVSPNPLSKTYEKLGFRFGGRSPNIKLDLIYLNIKKKLLIDCRNQPLIYNFFIPSTWSWVLLSLIEYLVPKLDSNIAWLVNKTGLVVIIGGLY
ncbi:hypothetical protein H4Q26_000598 [Puccinia striiformis f. sp. tritici PST-130]|nr:hypothetical protein H4Q26_000598 [Puccinia striiformis f. sp. tritici PST-130]